VIHKIGVRAEKRVEKELLDDFKRVSGKITVLFHIAEASVEQPDGRVRDVVFPAAGGERKLQDLVREYKSSGPAFRFQVHTYLRASYASHYRRRHSQDARQPSGKLTNWRPRSVMSGQTTSI